MPGGARAESRADRLKRQYVDNKVNATAAQANDMPEQGTDHLGNINLGLGFLSDAAGITAGALGMDNGIHQGKNGLSESDDYMKGRSTGAGWLNIGAGIINLGQSGLSMFSHGRKLYKLRNDRDSIKKTESKWGMAASATRGVGSFFKVASGAMGVAGVTDPTKTGFVAGTGALLNTAASVMDTIGAGKTATEYKKRRDKADALMLGAGSRNAYKSMKENSRNADNTDEQREGFRKDAKAIKARMYAMRQAKAVSSIKASGAQDRAISSGVMGIGAGLLSLGSALTKSLVKGPGGAAIGGLLGIGASAFSSLNKGASMSAKASEKASKEKLHSDVVDEYLREKAAKIIEQYNADRRAEAAAAAARAQADGADRDDADERVREAPAGPVSDSSGGDRGSSTTGPRARRPRSSSAPPAVRPTAHPEAGSDPDQPPAPDTLSDQEAKMIALARLGVYTGPIDKDAQFDIKQYYGHAFNAITKKRAKLILDSGDAEKHDMLGALGLPDNATEAEVASALGYEG